MRIRTTSKHVLILSVLVLGVFFAACGDKPFDIQLRDAELEIRTVTTGANFDVDGYRVEIRTRPDLDEDLDANDAVVIEIFPVGTYTVKLRDVASQCTVDDDDRRVELDHRRTTVVTFTLVCA